MPRVISHRDLVRRFRKLGFEGPYSGSRHLFMLKNNFRVRIPNPHGKDIPAFLVNEILRQADISKKEWDKLS